MHLKELTALEFVKYRMHHLMALGLFLSLHVAHGAEKIMPAKPEVASTREVSRDKAFSIALPKGLRRDTDSEQKYRSAFFWWGPKKHYCGIHPKRSMLPAKEILAEFAIKHEQAVGRQKKRKRPWKVSPVSTIPIDSEGMLHYYHSRPKKGQGNVTGLLVRGGLVYEITGTLPKKGLDSWLEIVKSIRWVNKGKNKAPSETDGPVQLLR
ncbi:MAG: hypothetical protein ABIJ61_01965 [bacterium]